MFDNNLPPDWPEDRMFTALACDGPRNGEYLTVREAEASGYQLEQWPAVTDEYHRTHAGEYVWMQAFIDTAIVKELAHV